MELKLSDQNWSANRITLKGLVVGFLILVLLIPTLFIMSLVSERAGFLGASGSVGARVKIQHHRLTLKILQGNLFAVLVL